MTPLNNFPKLRQTCLEICKGFTQDKFQGRTIYFKHVGEEVDCLLNQYENDWRTRILKIGHPSFEQALAAAYRDGKWDKERERKYLDAVEAYKILLRKSPKVFASVGMIDAHFETRALMQQDIIAAKIPRNHAIGDNAEDNALQATQLEEIRLCSFSDSNFTIPFFEDFDYLSHKDSAELQNLYYNKVSFIHLDSMKEVKRIVCRYYFSDKMALTESPADFFRVPLWKLTHFQTYLLRFGQKFGQHLPYCHDAPPHFYDEPDKLEYYSLMVQEGKGKTEKAGVSDVANINKMMGR